MFLKKVPKDAGCILIITQAALADIPYWHHKENWHLIFDEAIDPTQHLHLRVKDHIHLINEVLRVPKKAMNDEFYPAIIKNVDIETFRNRIQHSTDDFIWEGLSSFYQTCLHAKVQSFVEIQDDQGNIRTVTQETFNKNSHKGWKIVHQLEPLNPRCLLWVNIKAYQKLINQYERNKKVKKGQSIIDDHAPISGDFIATAVYHPVIAQGFKTSTFAGALFEYEMMFHLWQNEYGVEWKPSHLQNQIEVYEHQNKVEVYYLTENRWSLTMARKQVQGKTLMEYLDDIAKKLFINEETLFLSNNNFDRDLYKDFNKMPDNFVDCPYANRGLNDYRHMTSLYYSGAFNKHPEYYTFVSFMGLDEIAPITLNVGHLYQTLLRTDLRNPSSKTVKVLIPSLNTFHQIQHLFPNATIKPVNSSLIDESVLKNIQEVTQDGRVKENKSRSLYRDVSDAGRKARSRALKQYQETLNHHLCHIQAMNEGDTAEKKSHAKNEISYCFSSENQDVTPNPIMKDGCDISITDYFPQKNDDANLPELNPNQPDDLSIILNMKTSVFHLFSSIFDVTGVGPIINKDREIALDEMSWPSETLDDIIDDYQGLIKRVVSSKKNNLLSSAAIWYRNQQGTFDGQDDEYPSRGKTQEDVAALFGLFLDFDTPKTVKVNGQTKKMEPITLNDLQSIFPPDTRIVLHSTYSGGNKRRAFILFNRLVDVDTYKILAETVIDKLNRTFPDKLIYEEDAAVNTKKYLQDIQKPTLEDIDHAYQTASNNNEYTQVRRNCLDNISKTPSSLFFLPCQAAHPDETYCEVQGNDYLNVYDFILGNVRTSTIPGPATQQVIKSVLEDEPQDTDNLYVLDVPNANDILKTAKRVRRKTEQELYDEYVRPIISEMSPGHRNLLRYKVTKTCQRYCPSMKPQLISDIKNNYVGEKNMNIKIKEAEKDIHNIWNKK
jgi:hypothetical protein